MCITKLLIRWVIVGWMQVTWALRMRKALNNSWNLPLKEVDRPGEDRKHFCPCVNCLNGRRQVLDDIQEHLLFDGIKKNYMTWIWDGELTNIQRSESIDVEMGDQLEDMIRDFGQKSFQRAHAPMYDTLESDSKKSLYPRCKKSLTLLSVVLSLVNVKAIYEWSDKSFISLLQVVQDMPQGEITLPKSYYQVKKILCLMDMKYQKIHACPNDCILYKHEFEAMDKCPRCGCHDTKWTMMTTVVVTKAQRKALHRRCYGIFQSFQGLSVYLLMEMMQKASHGM